MRQIHLFEKEVTSELCWKKRLRTFGGWDWQNSLFRISHFQIHITLKNFLGERSFASPISNAQKVHQTDSNLGPHDQ